MFNTSLHFSSKTDDWATPQAFFDHLKLEFPFSLDPCASPENAKCLKFYTAAENGLKQDWSNDIVFCNPPYGREIGKWMQKAFESSRQGATVVCLVPSRTDTHWWHNYAMRGEVRLLRGRLKFGNAKNSAPFPSAIIIFRPPGVGLQVAR